MVSVISVIVLFSVLVAAHEFGHLLAAKVSKIKVERFSIGFGPAIIKWRKGETEYVISLLPVGGYVKLEGEDFEAEEGFYSQPFLKKTLVAAGGPFFNFLLAFFLIFILGSFSGIEQYPPVIYVPPQTTLYKEGLRTGDRIISINGKEVKSFKDILTQVSFGKKKYTFLILRDNKKIEMKIKLKKPEELQVFLPPVVGKVIKGSPAENVGLKENDTIIEINGEKIIAWQQLVNVVKNCKDSVLLKWKRNDKIFSSYVKPKIINGERKIGIWVNIKRKKLPLWSSFGRAIVKTCEITCQVLRAFWGLVTGSISVKNLGGPVFLAQISARASHLGIWYFISLLAILSVNLGIINLFPIPILDGGRILMFCIEKFFNRRFGKKTWTIAIQIGYVVIILLLVLATFNDIMRIFSK